MAHQYIFRALLLLSCGYAMWRGRSDERIVAAVCILATLASRLAFSPISIRYSGVEGGLLAIDIAVLACFVFVALRSSRFWPLWVAGLQLTSSMAHLMKAIDERLMPLASRRRHRAVELPDPDHPGDRHVAPAPPGRARAARRGPAC